MIMYMFNISFTGKYIFYGKLQKNKENKSLTLLNKILKSRKTRIAILNVKSIWNIYRLLTL